MQPETATPGDEMLVHSIQTKKPGWRELVSVILKRHHSSLLTRCFVYLHNHADAEDAAQETELRAYRAIRNFRGDSSFKTWLFSIADRQCHDLARKRARHVLDDHLSALIEIHEQNLVKVSESPEIHKVVNKILTGLPNRERDVLMLRFYVDLPLQDMASQLGLGLSATKMRLYRALELFGELLQAEQHA